MLVIFLLIGTHAHAYITSFTGLDDLIHREIPHKETGEWVEVCWDFSSSF